MIVLTLITYIALHCVYLDKLRIIMNNNNNNNKNNNNNIDNNNDTESKMIIYDVDYGDGFSAIIKII